MTIYVTAEKKDKLTLNLENDEGLVGLRCCQLVDAVNNRVCQAMQSTGTVLISNISAAGDYYLAVLFRLLGKGRYIDAVMSSYG